MPADERRALLDERCGDDTELRKEAEALLRHDSRDSGLDGKPVTGRTDDPGSDRAPPCTAARPVHPRRRGW